jgi:hypothetical protein
MRFNTAQLYELSGVRREQLRHWKKVLPPLSGRDGRCEQYTFPEVIAIAVISALVDDLGINVSTLHGCADELFALMHEYDLNALPSRLFVIPGGEVRTWEPNDSSYATVKLVDIVSGLRAKLAPAPRRQLLLPLTVET